MEWVEDDEVLYAGWTQIERRIPFQVFFKVIYAKIENLMFVLSYF